MEDRSEANSLFLQAANGNGDDYSYGAVAVAADADDIKRSIHRLRNNDNGNSITTTTTNNNDALHQSVRRSLTAIKESIRPFNASVREMGGSSTTIDEMFNLTRNIVGSGAFSIPSGFAALAHASTSRWSLLPYAALILSIMALVFLYYFILIGRVCNMVHASSYGDAYNKSVVAGAVVVGRRRRSGSMISIWSKISFLVPLSVIGMAGCGNVTCSMIIADTTRSLVGGYLGYQVSRTKCLLLVTIVVLLPLCMVKKLSVLAPFSAVGTAGIIFTLGVMGYRCWDGSYDANRGGEHLSSTPAEFQPLFESSEYTTPTVSDTFLLLCMCFQAFFCHYNAPRYYIELKQNSIERFSRVSNVAFWISAVIYTLIGSLGYYTFGANTDGFILNNYAPDDKAICICRFAIAVALIFSYPLPFIGARDGILDLFAVDNEYQSSTMLNLLSAIMLAVFTALATKLTDLGLVNAVGGTALGVGVVFIFPSIMFYIVVSDDKDASFALKFESILCLFLMLAGITIGTIGVIEVLTKV